MIVLPVVSVLVEVSFYTFKNVAISLLAPSHPLHISISASFSTSVLYPLFSLSSPFSSFPFLSFCFLSFLPLFLIMERVITFVD